MKKVFAYAFPAILLLAAVLIIRALDDPQSREVIVDFAVSDFGEGRYEVGSITEYVRNPNAAFDPWGARYGGEPYRALLEEISASGEPRTIVTEIWYPADRVEGAKRATYGDYVAGDEYLAQLLLSPFGQWISEGQWDDLAGELTGLARGSYVGAPAVEDAFPLIVLVHGLGGRRADWNDTAELLASRGYVVAAMTMPSDGGVAPVFADSDSRFAAESDANRLALAYYVMGEDFKMYPRMYQYLYGLELEVQDFRDSPLPDLSDAVAPSGGAERMAEMMARLLQQRVDDIGTVIDHLNMLASSRATCIAHFETLNLSSRHCGLLEGRVDLGRIGIAGHVLGSMTAQVALRQLPELAAGFGLNGGSLIRWEPQAYGIAPVHTLENIEEPMFFLHGTEDDYAYFLFQQLMGDWYEQAGGSRHEIFASPNELAPRTDRRTQPLVHAAYYRATGQKMIASVIDGGTYGVDDSTLIRFLADRGVEMPSIARRLPVHEKAEFSRNFQILGKAVDTENQAFRLPTFIAHYYLSAWFDLQLKSSSGALDRLLDPPFLDHVTVRQSGLHQPRRSYGRIH